MIISIYCNNDATINNMNNINNSSSNNNNNKSNDVDIYKFSNTTNINKLLVMIIIRCSLHKAACHPGGRGNDDMSSNVNVSMNSINNVDT